MKRATTRHNNISTVERRSGLVMLGRERSYLKIQYFIFQGWSNDGSSLRYKNILDLIWFQVKDLVIEKHQLADFTI